MKIVTIPGRGRTGPPGNRNWRVPPIGAHTLLLAWVALAAGTGGARAASTAPGAAAAESLSALFVEVDSLLARLPAVPAESIRVQALGDGQGSSAVLIRLGSRARVPGHVHRQHDEVVHVVRGLARMRAGAREFTVRRGAIVLVPRGLAHGAQAGVEGCAVVSIYAPVWDPADRYRDPRGDP